jgi:hypothetical protein
MTIIYFLQEGLSREFNELSKENSLLQKVELSRQQEDAGLGSYDFVR